MTAAVGRPTDAPTQSAPIIRERGSAEPQARGRKRASSALHGTVWFYNAGLLVSTLSRKLGNDSESPVYCLFHSSCPQQFIWSLQVFEHQAESRSPRGNSHPQPHSYSHLFFVVHRNTHAQHPQQPSSGPSVCAGTFLIVSPALDGSTYLVFRSVRATSMAVLFSFCSSRHV